MAGPARIQQSDLERFFEPKTVRALFSDSGGPTPGPRLTAACQRASRLCESYLRRAFTLEQIDALFEEDESIVALCCSLAMACGAEGRSAWSGQGMPFEGLYNRSMKELKEIADGARRSRGEDKGAGVNPTITGRSTPTQCPTFMFAGTARNPKRGGY